MAKFSQFGFSLSLSAALAAFVWLSGSFGAVSLQFALALLALSQAGYFALAKLEGAGARFPHSAYLFVAVVLASFFASSLPFFALSASLSLLFFPAALCAPAVGAVLNDSLFSGD